MSYERTKAAAKSVGLYRVARWVNRHVFDREELARRKADEAFYRQILRPGDLAFDVGANYGEKTLALLAAGARVVAFEPQPDCHAELLSRCGSSPRLTVLQKAVGATNGKAKLYVREKRGTSGLVQQWEGRVEGEITVDVTTLQDAIAAHGKPKFVKIDVEGFELQVLQGLKEPVPLTSFEYHLRDETIEQARACIRYLANLGRVEINFSPAEELRFALPQWLSTDEFDAFYPKQLQRVPGCEGYGDIFVRMALPANR